MGRSSWRIRQAYLHSSVSGLMHESKYKGFFPHAVRGMLGDCLERMYNADALARRLARPPYLRSRMHQGRRYIGQIIMLRYPSHPSLYF